MRTLIVYGTHAAMAGAMARHHPDVHLSHYSVRFAVMSGVYTIQSVDRPEDVVHGMLIDGPSCLERLRGSQCDVVIEDRSFELHLPHWRDLAMYTEGGRVDPYDVWHEFLRAHVLRRG